MKKILALLLIFVIVFSFVACGENDDDNGDEGSSVGPDGQQQLPGNIGGSSGGTETPWVDVEDMNLSN